MSDIEISSESDGECSARGCVPHPFCRRRSHVAAERLSVEPRVYRRMCRLGAPRVLLQLMAFTAALNIDSPMLDMNEMFAGVGHIVEAGVAAGFACRGFEINNSPIWEDACSPEGLVTMLGLAQQLTATGLSHWGTPCSTWAGGIYSGLKINDKDMDVSHSNASVIASSYTRRPHEDSMRDTGIPGGLIDIPGGCGCLGQRPVAASVAHLGVLASSKYNTRDLFACLGSESFSLSLS